MDAEANTLRIAVIGTGNIGGMLARAFASDSSHDVFVHNRSREKADCVKGDLSNIHVTDSAEDAAAESDFVFICTKAAEGHRLMEQLGPLLSVRQMLITTISTMKLDDMARQTQAGVAKIIPSIVQTAKSGILLVSCGSCLHQSMQSMLFATLEEIATPFAVSEEQIRVCSDLTSCGPAFLSFLLLQWADAAGSSGFVNAAEAEHLLAETLIGVAALLQQGMTLRDILQRVAVPGGVTERGLESLRRDSSHLFHHLHQATRRHTHGGQMANLSGRPAKSLHVTAGFGEA